MIMTAYISALKRDLELSSEVTVRVDLRQRLVEWYDRQPEISRCRPYAMVELEKALSTQGKYLSPILLALGWRRRRRWTSRGQYNRYWEPPLSTLNSATLLPE